MKEKRRNERRNPAPTEFRPCIDRAGNTVHKDRRKTPDRRLNNVWLELVRLRPGEVPADWGRKMQRCIREAGLS